MSSGCKEEIYIFLTYISYRTKQHTWRKLRNINSSLMQKIKNLKDLGRGVHYLQNIRNNFLHNPLEFIERIHPVIYCSLW